MSNGRRHRRWGHGTAAVARHLSDSLRPITQKELAAATNLTQPTVSNVLRQFSDGDAASANRPGWLPRHPALLDLYHENYTSRLDDNEASWYRIDDISAQVDDLIKRTADLVLSGDTAADVINPWRIPTTTIAYSAITNDQMEALGFVIAETSRVATIITRPIPHWRFAEDAQTVGRLRVAHRLHVAADLLSLSPDRDEHARRLVAS